jgi:hypothetical protein
VVVLDKSDCVERVEKLLDEVRVTNLEVPRLYALPKIHKPGGKMRPIVSNISAAHEKMAK